MSKTMRTAAEATARMCLGAALGVAVLCTATVAWAEPSFEFKIANQKAQTDGEAAVMELKATDDVKRGVVTLQRSDGKTRKIKLGKMGYGDVEKISLKQPRGTLKYSATIEASGPDGSEVTIGPLEFAVTWVDPIQVQIDKDQVDIGTGRIPLRSNRPLDRIEYEILDDQGEVVDRGVDKMGGEGGDLVLEFSPSDASVGAVRMKAVDVDDFWAGLILEPWFIKIPHEEVIFEFGKATWEDSEEPKLKASKKQILDAVKRFSRFRPDMRLYVAGYTDTVGSAGQNRQLSQERAQAIATWFRKNGLKIPVYYQGFGEGALAVETPDETAEARNRRAIYILANSPPPTSKTIPSRNWKRVR